MNNLIVKVVGRINSVSNVFCKRNFSLSSLEKDKKIELLSTKIKAIEAISMPNRTSSQKVELNKLRAHLRYFTKQMLGQGRNLTHNKSIVSPSPVENLVPERSIEDLGSLASTRGSNNIKQFHPKLFYKFILEKLKVIPYVSTNKRRLYKEGDQRGMLVNWDQILTALNSGYQIGIPHDQFLAIDIDAHKWKASKDLIETIKAKIINYFKNRIENCIIILSPAGGLHIYVKKSHIDKRLINRFCKLGFNSIDYLTGKGGINGPDLKERKIIHFPLNLLDKNSDLATLPIIWEPAFISLSQSKETQMFIKEFPVEFPNFLLEGNRRRYIIGLIRLFQLNKQQLIEINEDFCLPPKKLEELHEDVLQDYSKFGYSEITSTSKQLEFGSLNLESFVVNIKNDKLLRFDSDQKLWVDADLTDVMKANGFDISILNNIKPKLLMIYLKTNKGLNLDNEKSLKLQQQNLSEVLMFKDGIYGIKNGESKLIKIEEEEFKYFYIQNKLDIDSCQFNLKDKLEGNEILMKLPNTLKFISQVLGFNNPQLVAKYSLVLIYLAMLIYYKSHGGTKICKLQKLLSLTGPGGSGKSTLQDWFQKFVDETQVFATKSKHLSERFEKGFIKDKILLFINEIVPKNKGAIDVESLGDILSLSGADRQRSETKYESATTFNWDGLVVMTSNYPILTNTVESYGALKRRIINMVCLGNFMKGNRIRTQSIMSSLEDEIKLIKVLALQYIPLNIESILTFIEDFNTEQEILNHEETSLYSTHVDPLLCFLSEVVDNSDNNNNLVSFQQLKALYIHYIYRRSESNLTIEDFDDWWKWEESEMNNLLPKYPKQLYNDIKNPRNDLLNSFTAIDPILSNSTAVWAAMVKSRCRYINSLKDFKITKELIKYKIKEWNEELKEYVDVEKKAILPMIHNLKIKTSFLVKNDWFKGDFSSFTKEIPIVKIKSPTQTSYLEGNEWFKGDFISSVKEIPKVKIKTPTQTSYLEGNEWFKRDFISSVKDMPPVNLEGLVKTKRFSTLSNPQKTPKEEIYYSLNNKSWNLSQKYPKLYLKVISKLNKNLYQSVVNEEVINLKERELQIESQYNVLNVSKGVLEFNKLSNDLTEVLGKDISKLILKTLVNSLYSQNLKPTCEEKFKDMLFIRLNSLLIIIAQKLTINHTFLDSWFNSKNDEINFEIQNIKKAKMILKSNKKTLDPLNYLNELEDFNKCLRKIRRKLKSNLEIDKLEKFERILSINKIVLVEMLNVFNNIGIRIETIKVSSKKQLRFLVFQNLKLGNLFNIYAKLSFKPMLIQPLDWNIINDKVLNGGYLLNRNNQINLLHETKVYLNSKIKWSQNFINKINKLQKFPILIKIKWLNLLINLEWRTIEEFSENLSNEYAEWHDKAEPLNIKRFKLMRQFGYNHDEVVKLKFPYLQNLALKENLDKKHRKLISNIERIYCIIKDLTILSPKLNKTLKIWFPLHLDVSLRMYNWGGTNFITNKLFRLLESLEERLLTKDQEIMNDLMIRFYITCQIKRINNLSQVLSKDEIISISPTKKFRNSLNFQFYKELYLTNQKFPLGLDATSSCFQIIAVLFGDLDIAKATNLISGDYRDFYEILMGEIPDPVNFNDWTLNMKVILRNRKFHKHEIQFYMYGSTKLEGIKRIQQIDPTILTKQAKLIVEHVRNFIDKKCERIFKFKDCMNKLLKNRVSKGKPLLLNLQQNVIEYRYYKMKESKFRIQTDVLGKINNQISLNYPIDKIDTNKASNTILTTLIHSLDSKVNVEFRLEFKRIYNVSLSAVHDRFGGIPPYLYKEACVIYKRILYEHVFSLKLNDIWLIEEDDIDTGFKFTQNLIDLDKKNKEWIQGLLYSESYPLYPE